MASRVDSSGAMKQGSKGAGESVGRRRLQSALIVAQVAVSVVLLVGAGLLLASFYRLQSVDPGYQRRSRDVGGAVHELLEVSQRRHAAAVLLPLIERLESQPGVVSVAVTNAVPLRRRSPGGTPFQIEGRATDDPNSRPTADTRIVSASYLQDARRPARRRGARSPNRTARTRRASS